MEDTYKGESPGKKLARARFWAWAAEQRGSSFATDRHLVLASSWGGDVAVLRAMGVEPGRIVAVDRSRAAAVECARAWPGVDVRCCDARTLVEREGATFGVAHLDFCAQICRETTEVLAVAVEALPVGAILGTAFLRAREKDVGPSVALSTTKGRRYRRAWSAVLRTEFKRRPPDDLLASRITNGAPFEIRRLIELQKEKPPLLGPGYERASQLWNVLCHVDGAHELSVQFLVLDYHSRTPDGRGSPMTVAAWRVYERARYDETEEAKRRSVYENFAVDKSTVLLRALIVSAADPGLYNISRGTAAAWKAHATRGTYRKKEGASC
jgi:hypothetical protein